MRNQMRALKTVGVVLGLSLFSAGSLHSSEGLECPVPQASASQIESVNKLLPDFEDFRDLAKVASAIETLKNDNDNFVEIVNSVIAAYCPLLDKQQGMTVEQKTVDVRHFGLTVTREVYSLSSENSVIVDVELPQTVFEQIEEKAKSGNTTPSKWIENNITEVLSQ